MPLTPGLDKVPKETMLVFNVLVLVLLKLVFISRTLFPHLLSGMGASRGNPLFIYTPLANLSSTFPRFSEEVSPTAPINHSVL